MLGLYAIVDVTSVLAADLEVLPFAEAVLAARPVALQLRDKSSRRGGRRMLELLRQLAPMCRSRGVPLLANDRVDLALLAGADGVHVGQDDLPGGLARDVLARGRGGLVGVSAHNEAEVERALAERPDYVGLGPVFGTTTKENPDPTLGLAGLERLVAMVRAAGLPPVAIGGIRVENAGDVAARCPSGAVIAGLCDVERGLPQDERYARVTARAQELHARLSGGAASP
ncbi:MAG: thiamine phosphate synthase [Deltaproteobacteria bacterium]|nr:thiamine phosphate synthase [Deltaproteobacteria bacterium]